MIQVRKQYGNLYVKILDTAETFDTTMDRLFKIKGRTFNPATGEWMFGLESVNDLLLWFDHQIVWNEPLTDILKGYEVHADETLVKRHLDWEASSEFKDFHIKPYPYQQVAAHFLAERGFGAVLDSVGLGKTLSIIGTFHLLHKRGKANKCLIVTISSVKTQWAKEIEKFTDYKATAIVGSTSKTRKKRMREFADSGKQFMIINYEMLRDEEMIQIIHDIGFDMVALDEAHKIKSGVQDKQYNINASATALGAYKLLNIAYRFIATATPIQSKAEEAWALFHFVHPDILGSWEHFRDYFCDVHPRYGVMGGKNLGDLYYRIAPYFIRRTKEMPEIRQQLPTVQPNHVFLEMTQQQQQLQDVIIEKLQEAKERAKSFEYGSEEQRQADGIAQAYYTMLIETCDNIDLLTHEEAGHFSWQLVKDAGINNNGPSPKMVFYREYIDSVIFSEEGLAEGNKIIVFTEYERMARMLKDQYAKHTVTITGSNSDKERAEAVDRIWNDPETKIFIGTKAASAGLNLQVCNHMMHFDLPFVPSELEQRNGRIDRSGSTHSTVTMTYLIMENSYEEQLLELLDKKTNIASEILTGVKATGSKSNLAEAALKKLQKRKAKQYA